MTSYLDTFIAENSITDPEDIALLETAWHSEQFQEEVITAVLLDADPVAWIEANFYIPELRGPIRLYPYQKAVLREAYRRDEDGRFVYSLVLWSDIKKSAKSTIAATVALHRAQTQWASIKIVANDLKQADSRVSYYFRRSLELSPDYEERVNYKKRGYSVLFPQLNSSVEAIPIDPGGEAGGNDDLIVFSELWAAKHQAIQQMWVEMTLSPLKFGFSQRWVETYAGYEEESPLLEQLYDRGMEGEQLDLSYEDEDGGFHDLSDLRVYANGDMLCLWNDRPRLPWQTDEYYASEEAVLDAAEFNRIHRNQWASSTAKFVPDLWWERCEAKAPLSLSGYTPLYVAMDAGVSNDSFGIIAIAYDEIEDMVEVHFEMELIPPLHGEVDFDEAETAVVELLDNWNVLVVVYDPYQLKDMAQRLGKKYGGGVFVEFSQGPKRAIADNALRTRIKQRRVRYNGKEALSVHVRNANAQQQGENKLRLVKRNAKLKIDLAVALSMASYTAADEEVVYLG